MTLPTKFSVDKFNLHTEKSPWVIIRGKNNFFCSACSLRFQNIESISVETLIVVIFNVYLITSFHYRVSGLNSYCLFLSFWND